MFYALIAAILLAVAAPASARTDRWTWTPASGDVWRYIVLFAQPPCTEESFTRAIGVTPPDASVFYEVTDAELREPYCIRVRAIGPAEVAPGEQRVAGPMSDWSGVRYVPEPEGWMLLLAGVAALAILARLR